MKNINLSVIWIKVINKVCDCCTVSGVDYWGRSRRSILTKQCTQVLGSKIKRFVLVGVQVNILHFQERKNTLQSTKLKSSTIRSSGLQNFFLLDITTKSLKS